MIQTVDFSKSEQYTLSIRLSADGFSFSVFNPLPEGGLSDSNRKIDESLSLTANLKQTFRELEWLKHSFYKVNIIVADKRFTLVPLDFFEDEQCEMLFYHNHPKRDNEIVQYNILQKNNTVVLFGMDKSAYSFLQEQYPNARFCAQASPLIEHFSAKSRLGNTRKMYADLQSNYANIYCYDRGRLLLANSFECKVTADRLYYLLYIWKQLGFEQMHDELHLSGNLEDKDALVSQLQKFIKQVFIVTPALNIDLQAITTCE